MREFFRMLWEVISTPHGMYRVSYPQAPRPAVKQFTFHACGDLIRFEIDQLVCVLHRDEDSSRNTNGLLGKPPKLYVWHWCDEDARNELIPIKFKALQTLRPDLHARVNDALWRLRSHEQPVSRETKPEQTEPKTYMGIELPA